MSLSRREFLKVGGLALGGLALRPGELWPSLPTLEEFVESLPVKAAHLPAGVYASKLFAFPVVQNGNAAPYESNVVGDYAYANQSYWLLAHNYLAGVEFSKLSLEKHVHLVLCDKSLRNYVITDHTTYKDVDGRWDNFLDVETGAVVNDAIIFERLNQNGRLIFQTSLAEGGNLRAGLRFFIGLPQNERIPANP